MCVCVKYDYYKSNTVSSSGMGSDPLCNVLYKSEQKESLCSRNLKPNSREETAHRSRQADRRGTGKGMKDGKEQYFEG